MQLLGGKDFSGKVTSESSLERSSSIKKAKKDDGVFQAKEEIVCAESHGEEEVI